MENNTPSPKKESSIGLSEQVKMLEQKYNSLKSICKEMVVTLLINRIRGNIKTNDDGLFDKIVENWKSMLNETVKDDQTDEQLPPAEKSFNTQSSLSLGEKEKEKDGI